MWSSEYLWLVERSHTRKVKWKVICYDSRLVQLILRFILFKLLNLVWCTECAWHQPRYLISLNYEPGHSPWECHTWSIVNLKLSEIYAYCTTTESLTYLHLNVSCPNGLLQNTGWIILCMTDKMKFYACTNYHQFSQWYQSSLSLQNCFAWVSQHAAPTIGANINTNHFYSDG